MKTKVLYIFMFLCISINAQQNAEKEVNRFFATYQKQPEKAVRDLYQKNKWSAEVSKDIDYIVEVVNNLPPSMGKYLGKEKLKQEKIGTVLIKYTYMVKYERQPVFFYFIFYKSQKQWIIHSFSLNDKLDKFFN